MSEIVYKVIQEVLTDDVDKIKPEARLIDDLGADSLTAVEIVMELEKKLNKKVDLVSYNGLHPLLKKKILRNRY